ncbi:MAG TPA: NADPH-dependent glutamate synthase [Firmicutes bacterium]|nr:NADPH-dependent glutamate synthase [Bacillota bacterium]
MADSEQKSKPKKQQIPRQPMPEQPAEVRRRNFEEVPYGYSLEVAKLEAERCIQCKKPLCVAGCPVGIDIPGFIKLLAEGDVRGSIHKMKETNILPAICGRVCPQETQCEEVCILGKKGKPVAIGRLERFIADWERASGKIDIPEMAPPSGKRVAIVGSGPAGLTVAADCARMGHEVEIFEALHKPGGVLVYGIPEFRLPKSIVDAEVHTLERMGVKIHCNHVVGKLETIDELQEEFDAVFIGTGAGLPWFMGVPGEDLIGVYSANEYLTRANLMGAFDFPINDTPTLRGLKVATIGGGNVAMDSARTAVRLGAEESYIIYRRSEVEMPARIEEIHHAKEEGVDFRLLTTPVRFIGNEDGYVTGMELLKMELGEPDDSGRRRPVPIEGSNYHVEVDTVIVAIGNGPNPLIAQTTPDIDTKKWGEIIVDDKLMTTRDGVFAGGDIVLGAATVILAMGQGRQAAEAINEYFHRGDPHDLADKLKSAVESYLAEFPSMKPEQVKTALTKLRREILDGQARQPEGSPVKK